MKKRLLSLTTTLALLSTPLLAEDLLQVTHYALEQDPQLQISRLGVAIKQQQQQQAQSLLLPSLSGSASYNYGDNSKFSDENRSESYSLSLTQPLYHRDTLKTVAQTRVLSEESELGLELARQQLLLQVATAYFDQLSAEDSRHLAEQEKRAIAEQLKQTRNHHRVGTASLTDLQEVQARYDLVNAQLVSARADVENSREALFEIINRAPSPLQPLRKEAAIERQERTTLQQWIDTALEQSLSLQQQRKRVESARLAIEVEKSAHYPTLDLVGQLSNSDNSNTLYGADSDNYSIGIEATLSLYRGGSIRAKISEALLSLQQTEVTLEQKRRSTVKAVRSNHLAVHTTLELVKANQQALTSAETLFHAIQRGVEVGTRTTADLLDAQKEHYRAQHDLARSRYDLLLAQLSLKQSSGILRLSDIETVNRLLESQDPVRSTPKR